MGVVMETWKLFSAPWCAACPATAAAIRELCEDFPSVELQEFDVSTPAGAAEARRYHVMGLPTRVVLVDDVPVQMVSGSSIVNAARQRKEKI